MRLVHLTDPHLTSLAGERLFALRGKRWLGYLSWKRKRRLVHRSDVLARVTEAVGAERPAQILVSGDLAHIGLGAEIAAATAWLETLGPPERVMLVPGNHDYYRADSWAPIRAHWSRYLGIDDDVSLRAPAEYFPRIRHVHEQGVNVTVLGLCSAYPAPLLLADGRLGAGQLLRLEAELDQAEGFRCVLLHHPPLPGLTARRKALRDADELAGVLTRQRPELVLHGHVHRNRSTAGGDGMHIFATASASSGQTDALASYRVFDVAQDADGWLVAMHLKGITPEGRIDVLTHSSWRVGIRQLASVL